MNRIALIADLGMRRDRILQSPDLDIGLLAALAEDCEAADMPNMAADLRRRLEWYRSSVGGGA
jgi:hypothetical protein